MHVYALFVLSVFTKSDEYVSSTTSIFLLFSLHREIMLFFLILLSLRSSFFFKYIAIRNGFKNGSKKIDICVDDENAS